MRPASSPALPTWKMPTRLGAAWFGLRVWGHVFLRAMADLVAPRAPRHAASEGLAPLAVLSEHRSPLWTDGRPEEFALVAGKVHNLRVARRAFDGVVVPAGRVFSFWRQLGRPSRWRGFVAGRELRAGCVVPVVAGGLCQLSNALASAAAAAGMTFVERHGHTARIERGEGNAVDATVFWNDRRRAGRARARRPCEHPRARLPGRDAGRRPQDAVAAGPPASAQLREVASGNVEGLIVALRAAVAARARAEETLTPA